MAGDLPCVTCTRSLVEYLLSSLVVVMALVALLLGTAATVLLPPVEPAPAARSGPPGATGHAP